MQRIYEELLRKGRLGFTDLFQPGQHKSSLISVFLAILELVRHHGVITTQNHLFGEISIIPGTSPTDPGAIAPIETYEHGPAGETTPTAENTSTADSMPTAA